MSEVPQGSPPPVALYVHFPFCLSVCPYCEFVVYAGRAARGDANRVKALVDALVTEIRLRSRPGSQLRSVYLGGGTPSLMDAAEVARILAAADRAFGIAREAEITIEANPGDSERGDLAGFRAAGVNRLSIGAQSLHPAELQRLGRRHGRDDVRATVRAARAAGLGNVSIDLLYDVPGQTLTSWRDSLHGTIALEPDHISVYALNVEQSEPGNDHLPTSRGAARWRARARATQDGDRAARMYEIAEEELAAAGLEWYEISNWARVGAESRHNLTYWLGDPWEAVGPGAHAYDGRRTRRWNAAPLSAYMSAVANGELPPGGADEVDEATAAAERTLLALRTSRGAPLAAIRSIAEWASANGLVEPIDRGHVRLTVRGRLLSNEVFERLLPDDRAVVAA